MNDNKRKGDMPIPEHVEKYLNEDQQAQLQTLERFGWNIKFIRRPLFQEPVVIVVNPSVNSIAVVENDGRLNQQPGIELRA